MKKSLILLLVLSFNLSAQKVVDDVVIAEVNGAKIYRSELEQYHDQNLNYVGSSAVTKEKSLQDLINRVLGIQKAKKEKLDQDPKVINKMNDILYHAQISKDMEGKLLKITVSDDEVKKYYRTHPEYRTAQILYRLRVNPSAEDVKAALEQMTGIYNEVAQTPDKFLEYASKYSQVANAPMGADMGFQPAARLTPEYFAAIKNQKDGYITKPFRSQYGYHVVKVLGVKKYEQIDKNMYKKIIYDIKRDALLDEYYKELQKGAKISISKDKL
jgi:parvulin-like peptidyl-prolyl isomerase